MRSPFPGMDPYLEQHWGDVHTRLIVHSSGHIQRQLPGDLCARIEERVYVETEEDRRQVKPDLRVVEYPGGGAVPGAQTSASAVAEPLLLELPDEERNERYIEIRESRGGRVVTSIEFLSPANKFPGEGREKYRQKRNEMKAGGVNLVEIDLVRAGERDLYVPQHKIPTSHRQLFQACVWRAARPFHAELYAFPLREPLPSIRIPLRPEDKDVVMDLQTLVRQCYEEGRFHNIDYSVPPEPPLEGEDAAWATEQVKATHH